MLCGRFPGGKEADITSTIDPCMIIDYFTKECKAEIGRVAVTGFLFMRQSSWIHVYESSFEVSKRFLKDLCKAEGFDTVKVLSVDEGVGARVFPVWACKSIDSR